VVAAMSAGRYSIRLLDRERRRALSNAVICPSECERLKPGWSYPRALIGPSIDEPLRLIQALVGLPQMVMQPNELLPSSPQTRRTWRRFG
jgi:hypothetical protein